LVWKSESAHDAQSGRSYASATESLRATTRWLLAVAAATGAVLVTGLQLTGLGQLGAHELGRLALGVVAILVALGGVAVMIWLASRLLADEWVSLADLTIDRFEGRVRDPEADVVTLGESLDLHADELYAFAAEDVQDLYQRLKVANAAARDQPIESNMRAVWVLRRVASDVVDFANYRLTLMRFGHLRRQLAYAAAVATLGIIAYAWAVNPPPACDPGTAYCSSPTSQTSPHPTTTGAPSVQPSR
jgi:hypothetical protein